MGLKFLKYFFLINFFLLLDKRGIMFIVGIIKKIAFPIEEMKLRHWLEALWNSKPLTLKALMKLWMLVSFVAYATEFIIICELNYKRNSLN